MAQRRRSPARPRARAAGALLVGLHLGACSTGSAPTVPAAEPLEARQPEQVQIGGVSWFVDYDAALAVARQQDKALWVHFGENPG